VTQPNASVTTQVSKAGSRMLGSWRSSRIRQRLLVECIICEFDSCPRIRRAPCKRSGRSHVTLTWGARNRHLESSLTPAPSLPLISRPVKQAAGMAPIAVEVSVPLSSSIPISMPSVPTWCPASWTEWTVVLIADVVRSTVTVLSAV
jgi:hypothetical protein